jgi:hypothetical protein
VLLYPFFAGFAKKKPQREKVYEPLPFAVWGKSNRFAALSIPALPSL